METLDVTLEDVREAQQRIAPWIRRTPLLSSERLDAHWGAQLFFKCENLQEIGAFKVRGATNAVFALAPERLRAGVVTHSSGNHGIAVARAARQRGVSARVVMPENAAAAKVAAVRSYGAEVLYCAPSLAAREALAARVVAEIGAAFVHPYDDPRVIAGQGTVALELIDELPQLDLVLCPVGGGGLCSGVSVVIKALRPAARVIAVEPAAADDAYRGFHGDARVATAPVSSPASSVVTLADGLRGSLSERTYDLMRRYVDDVVTVSEPAIVAAMRELWTQLHVIIEASSAVPYAALLEKRLSLAGQRVAIVLTGGNVDLDALPWCQARPSSDDH